MHPSTNEPSPDPIDNCPLTLLIMCCAQAYGIQAQGGTFVTSIKGDYHSAVGFPMHRFAATLDCSRLKRWVERSS
jgi:predicted house-cleaning NTP pyrophosphatase (Maf/HAM1 superfamily)